MRCLVARQQQMPYERKVGTIKGAEKRASPSYHRWSGCGNTCNSD